MKHLIAILLLLSLGLTGCIVEPGGGYREHGWNNGHHGDHDDRGGHMDRGNRNR